MPREPAAELLRREGAVPADDVVRWLAEACGALGAHRAAGVEAGVTLEALHVSRTPGEAAQVDAASLPAGTRDVGRAQVRALAAVGYELLRGLPPPQPARDDDWVGVRPELKAVLAPALEGAGAGDPTVLALQLRALGRAETAGYAAAPPVADTHVSQKAAAPQAKSRTGEIFGTWELLGLLGSGGMGDVYRARHVRLGREAAVKVLRDELAAMPDVVQRFFQEARVVNEINHPHIVQIFDFVEEPQRVYCVMELLQGRSLARLAEEDGPLPVKRVCRLLAQACDALEAAHDRGVVHRDVKPDNLFVTVGADGRDVLKVLDFGVARRLSGEGGRTQHGLVLGTPYYMAPEQAAGRAVDARADVYSLGVALFELLSGQELARLEKPGAVTVTGAGGPVPPELTKLIASCLELDPDKRPASAAAVGAVLKRVAEAPVGPRPSTQALAAAAGIPTRRVPRFAWAGVGAVVVLGAGLWWAVTRPVDTTRPPDAPPPAPTDVAPPRVDPPPASPLPVEPPPPETPPAQPPVKPPVARPVKRPPVVKDEPPPPNPLAGRTAEAQRRYARLVERYGAAQLTSIERAAVAALQDEARRDAVQAATLEGAEAALADAERRLER